MYISHNIFDFFFFFNHIDSKRELELFSKYSAGLPCIYFKTVSITSAACIRETRAGLRCIKTAEIFVSTFRVIKTCVCPGSLSLTVERC